MAQWSRVFPTLPQDLTSVPSTHSEQLTSDRISISRRSRLHKHLHTHTLKSRNRFFKEIIETRIFKTFCTVLTPTLTSLLSKSHIFSFSFSVHISFDIWAMARHKPTAQSHYPFPSRLRYVLTVDSSMAYQPVPQPLQKLFFHSRITTVVLTLQPTS